MEIKDTYKTIVKNTEEVLFKEKNSKFFGYAFPVNNEKEVKEHLVQLKKKHSGAIHFCYAYQIGTEQVVFRANDDGEPSNSAGMPIYGQIQSFELTEILVVVVRYFGGIKLGVGGLISAYKTTAQLVLLASNSIEKTINRHFTLHFEYKNLTKVMRVIKEKNIMLVAQKMELQCELQISVRKKDAKEIHESFVAMHEIKIT